MSPFVGGMLIAGRPAGQRFRGRGAPTKIPEPVMEMFSHVALRPEKEYPAVTN